MKRQRTLSFRTHHSDAAKLARSIEPHVARLVAELDDGQGVSVRELATAIAEAARWVANELADDGVLTRLDLEKPIRYRHAGETGDCGCCRADA